LKLKWIDIGTQNPLFSDYHDKRLPLKNCYNAFINLCYLTKREEQMKSFSFWIFILSAGVLSACQSVSSPTPSVVPSKIPTALPSDAIEKVTENEPLMLSITLGDQITNNGITLDSGGDVDTKKVQIDGMEARQSGNGVALASADGNSVPDSFFQFNVDDKRMYAGSPTSQVRVEVDYLDQGADSFSLEYDASPTSGSKGIFSGGGAVAKTDSGEIRTAVFTLRNAHFANRDNGADFRFGDDLNGSEIIREVRVIGFASNSAIIDVDEFGANPMDELPDSTAIQQALDSSSSGDTIVFTSGVNSIGYQGYLVDKTIFLTGRSAKHDLTFTSSDPQNHALLRATQDLKGYVVRLYARTRFSPRQDIFNIDFGYINVDGGRDVRVCMGQDQTANGAGDNWGSWLPECGQADDPWCHAGNMAFDDGYSGIVVHDLIDQQTECGSALAFFVQNGKNNIIHQVIIDTAGDHVHASGCTNSDNDGDDGAWSDGITAKGNYVQITNNTIINPTDIGIVTFGGRGSVIANNTVKITAGNNGAFAAIAIHPWDIANASEVQITGNVIINEGDSRCGGLHAGINIGGHMWGGACFKDPVIGTFGNPSCSANPDPDQAGLCTGAICQLWLLLPEGQIFTLKNNTVTGAHVNYLIEGLIIKGQFIDENNISLSPRQSDWYDARFGCNGLTWGPLDKVAHHPSRPDYTDLTIHCER
jgi:hypothetical protein